MRKQKRDFEKQKNDERNRIDIREWTSSGDGDGEGGEKEIESIFNNNLKFILKENDDFD